MTTQQVIALAVISAFVIGLFAYAYFLGRKAGRSHRQHCLLFDFLSCDASRVPTMGISPQSSTSEGSGHALAQELIEATPASLSEAPCIDTQKTESLCCEAAGIIHPLSSPTEAPIPHDKLRVAAPTDGTLPALDRSHAQPVKGYTHCAAAFEGIATAIDSTLSKDDGAYTTTHHMAQAIYDALDQSGILQAPKGRVKELEDRIMSYTGLAVTKSDYDQLTKAAETLQLAQRTWETAKGTEPWCVRAHNGRLSIQSIARRIHAQLRNAPTSTPKAGETA